MLRHGCPVRCRGCVAVWFRVMDTVTDSARLLDSNLVAGNPALRAAPLICNVESGPRFRNAWSDAQMIAVQDYAAVRGQGTIADRGNENLSLSDAGIIFLRKVFLRELEAIRAGQPPRDGKPFDEQSELPVHAAEAATHRAHAQH